MPDYELELAGIGTVAVTEKRGMRSLRMRISPKGQVLVSVPPRVPHDYVEKFILDRRDWILDNLPKNQPVIINGGYFAGNVKLVIREGAVSRSRSAMMQSNLIIHLKGIYDPINKTQQEYIEKKILLAMNTLAERTLLPRLEELATRSDHKFNQAYVKPLISRWGSCDSNQNIILNTYLVQVPKILQDYVIYHELTHTKHMHHGKEFWSHMASLQPSYKLYRSMLKKYQTAIVMTENPSEP